MSLKYRNKATGQMVEVVDLGYHIDKEWSLEERMSGPNFVNWPVAIFFQVDGKMQLSMLKTDFLKTHERVEEESETSREYRILKVLQTHEKQLSVGGDRRLTVETIAERTGLTNHIVQDTCLKLDHEGKVVMIGMGNEAPVIQTRKY